MEPGNKDTLLATCLLELFGVTIKVYENITYADKYPNNCSGDYRDARILIGRGLRHNLL